MDHIGLIKIFAGFIGVIYGTKVFIWLSKYLRKLWLMKNIPGPKNTLFFGHSGYFNNKHARK
jgi:hypothetical protein